MRVIFYGEPISLEESTKLKKVADKESEEARWVTIEELAEIGKSEKIRGLELFEWGKYLNQGG